MDLSLSSACWPPRSRPRAGFQGWQSIGCGPARFSGTLVLWNRMRLLFVHPARHIWFVLSRVRWINVSSGWIKMESASKPSFPLPFCHFEAIGGRGGSRPLWRGRRCPPGKYPGEDGGDKPGLLCESHPHPQVGGPGRGAGLPLSGDVTWNKSPGVLFSS